jgi:hypothetical protein
MATSKNNYNATTYHNSPLNAPPDGRSTDGSNVRPKNGRNSSPVADCSSRSATNRIS